jgi:hypothetical protein
VPPNQPCASPLSYAVGSTNNGQHQFGVEAVDAAGNVSSVASYTWKVIKNSGQNYTISATVPNPLSPGAQAQTIPISFNSPNNGNGGSGVNGTQVTNLTITISSITGGGPGPNSCTAADFQINPVNASAYPFYVPFGTSNLSAIPPFVTHPEYLPTIQMLNRTDSVPGNGSGNQNACKGATIHLSLAGTP